MNYWTRTLAVCAACLARAVWAAGPASAPAPDLAARFPPIHEQLASSEYQVREAGQKELDKIPATRLEELRTLAAKEADPEVKARLDERVAAMELCVLIHPAPLSVRFANATLAEVAAELNRQLGDTVVQSIGGTGKFTLAADDQPFWEIINQLSAQSPIATTSLLTASAGGTRYTLRLSQLAGAPRTYQLIDTFAVTPQMSGQPATGNWAIMVRGYSDPRVRVSQYSQLRVEKITDQDGNSLLPLAVTSSTAMVNSVRPMIAWSSSATFSPAPGVTRIKELRAGIALALVEKEKTVSIDLTKDPVPIDGPRGKITVEPIAAANGNMMLRISPATAADNAPAASAVTRSVYVTIRVFDKDDKVVQTILTTLGGVTQIGMAVQAAAGQPTKVEISWPEKTRDMVLPVELRDIDVPAPVPVLQPIVRPLPAVVPVPPIKPLVLPD